MMKINNCDYGPNSVFIFDQNYCYPETSGNIDTDTLFILT